MPQVQWIDEIEAAKILELSVKRVRQFAGAGAVKTKRETNPETNRPRTMYQAGDVERLKDERLNRVKAASTQALVPRGQMEAWNRMKVDGALQIAAAKEEGKFPLAPPIRPWLRISELAAEWEVSEGAIFEMIRSGELPARRFTCRDPWRIHRADADEFRGVRRRTEGEISPLAAGGSLMNLFASR